MGEPCGLFFIVRKFFLSIFQKVFPSLRNNVEFRRTPSQSMYVLLYRFQMLRYLLEPNVVVKHAFELREIEYVSRTVRLAAQVLLPYCEGPGIRRSAVKFGFGCYVTKIKPERLTGCHVAYAIPNDGEFRYRWWRTV